MKPNNERRRRPVPVRINHRKHEEDIAEHVGRGVRTVDLRSTASERMSGRRPVPPKKDR